jgi:uncharacterized membrane protein
MNETLQNKLVAILNAIQSSIQTTGTFILEQLPDIALQYLAFGRVATILWVLVGIFILVAGFILTSRSVKQIKDSVDRGAATLFGGGITLVCGVPFILYNLNNMLLVWFAPKVWLLLELKNFIK